MISLVIGLIIVGVLLYIVETMLPMDAMVKRLIQIVVVLCLLVYVARFFGVF
jgi:hypothetical protein